MIIHLVGRPAKAMEGMAARATPALVASSCLLQRVNAKKKKEREGRRHSNKVGPIRDSLLLLTLFNTTTTTRTGGGPTATTEIHNTSKQEAPEARTPVGVQQ